MVRKATSLTSYCMGTLNAYLTSSSSTEQESKAKAEGTDYAPMLWTVPTNGC